LIEDYFQHMELLIASDPVVHLPRVTYDKRSATVGFIRGELIFLDGSQLHFREYVHVLPTVERYAYAYHYQSSATILIFRYDNTPHSPTLPNFPHHKHVNDETNVVSVNAPDLQTVLTEIRKLVTYSV